MLLLQLFRVTGRLKHNFFGSASSVVIAVCFRIFQQPVTEIIERLVGARFDWRDKVVAINIKRDGGINPSVPFVM
jgi:hypothetical protein